MEMIPNKIQINGSVKTDAIGKILEKSTLINIRCDDVSEAVLLFNQLRFRLNSDPMIDKPSQDPGQVMMKMIAANRQEEQEERTCPKCGSELKRRKGKNGDFLGCVRYPICRHTEQL